MATLPRFTFPALLGCAVLALAACNSRPVHYPDRGTSWELPIVDPMLATGVVVPATIHGQGPFLFLLDPDAATTIDIGVANQLKLFSPANSWQQATTARDRNLPRRPFEIMHWQSGDLKLRNFRAFSAPAGSLRVAERRIHGILGGDMLTRNIVIDIDRDRGVVALHTAEAFRPPRRAAAVAGRALRNPSFTRRGLAVPTHVSELGEIELVVALSAPATALRPAVYSRHPGEPRPSGKLWVDDSGDRQRARSAKQSTIVLGPHTSEQVMIDELPDRRLWSYDFPGVLGQDVLARYRAIYDRDRRRLWLQARESNLAVHLDARISRWNDRIKDCERGRCVRIELRSDALRVSAPAASGIRTVTLEAVDERGAGLGSPIVQATLTPGKTATVPLPETAGSSGFRVIDLSPLAR
ncbi:MAG: hypothetical protein KJO07_11660 [Deltaproteobacteria bacterium]|nr:hypothetical protein [Deltaproteobacteria bacterium]